MEPNILDLRQQRCPLALLLAKRHTVQMNAGESLTILLSDPGSKRDIEAYLHQQAFRLRCESDDGYSSLHIIKERGSNV